MADADIVSYVLSFDSTHLAMAADCALKREGVSYTMLPTPKQISAGCGIALRLGASDIDQALACLSGQSPAIASHPYAVHADGVYSPC